MSDIYEREEEKAKINGRFPTSLMPMLRGEKYSLGHGALETNLRTLDRGRAGTPTSPRWVKSAFAGLEWLVA